MNQVTSILYYIEEEVDLASLHRVMKVAKYLGAKATLGAVVKPARSQVLLARGSLDLDEIERLVVEDCERKLNETASKVRDSNVEFATRVFVGHRADSIIRAVQNNEFDMLAKLPTPTKGLRQQLFGGLDMRLMRACPCPVSINRVKPGGLSGHVVAAVDCDEGDETKADLNQTTLNAVAMVLSDEFQAVSTVHIVHAWALYGESLLASGRGKLPTERFQNAMQQEETQRKEWLDDLVDRYRKSLDATAAERFRPQIELLHGDPMEAIPQRVKELDADTLVIGTVSRSGVSGALIGNTAEAILNRVDCSVVALKPKGFISSVPPQ